MISKNLTIIGTTIAIIFFSCPQFASSSNAGSLANIHFVSSSDVPTEFALLIDSFQHYPLDESERRWISKKIVTFDSLFALLTKEERLFMTKATIYKELLLHRYSNYNFPAADSLSLNSIMSQFQQKLHDKSISRFTHWLITSIGGDLKRILPLPTKEDDSYLGKERELKHLLPLTQAIYYLPLEELQFELFPLLKKMLTRLENQLILFVNQSIQAFKPNNKSILSLNFFSTKYQRTESTVDSINKILLPKGSDQLIVPALPQPTGEWSGEGESKNKLKQPTVDPNYTPPPALPRPVDDWKGEKSQ